MNYSCLIVKVERTAKVERVLKRRKINLSSDFKNFFCVSNKVFSDADIKKIKNGKNILENKKLAINKFSHLEIDFLLSEKFAANNKIDAEKKILDARNEIIDLNYILVQEPIDLNKKVYAFKLIEDVLKNKKFIKANTKYKKGMPLLYVGETSKDIYYRFNQHLDKIKSSKFMYEYGIRDFEISNWSDNIIEITNINPLGLNCFNSKFFEREIALKLRELGYGVWFN
jgi:hypothetical protein